MNKTKKEIALQSLIQHVFWLRVQVYTNNKTVFILDENFELLYTLNLSESIEEIYYSDKNLIIKSLN